MQRAIQGDIVEVEADDPVEGGKCLGLELLEHACMDPFITSGAQVVSDTWWSRIASPSTHDAPVTRRIMIPLKHSRSGTRGRWHPRGWDRLVAGRSGSTACQMTSMTSGSSARMMTGKSFHRSLGLGCTRHETGTNATTGGWSPTKRVQERIVELQLADPGLELLDELTECATVGLKGGVARYAG